MNFSKKILASVAAFCVAAVAVYAEPKIEQKLVMSDSSLESVKTMASDFCNEVKNDSNIRVKSVNFSKNGYQHFATIVCLVTEVDRDFMRVEEKLTGRKFSSEQQDTAVCN